jgi:cytochrome c biogenesis protein CcdA
MNEWIYSVINSNQAGALVFAAVFLLGVISVFTCACNFAVIGAITGYTGAMGATSKTKAVVVSSVFFLVGAVVAMSAIGGIIGYASEFISVSLGNYWKIGAGVILILFGVYILDILPFKLPGVSLNFQNRKNGIAGAVIFGLVIGGLTVLSSICCNPILPVILAASLVKGSTLWGFFLLFFYALGYGSTIAAAMLGIGLGIGKLSKALSKVAVVIKYAGGITLIVLGFYFLITI